MNNKVQVNLEISLKITDEDIEDIACTALYGGIDYWCDSYKILGESLGSSCEEHIAHGGTVIICVKEEYTTIDLTKDVIIEGLKLYLGEDQSAIVGDEIDTTYIDTNAADIIVQYGLFGEVVYC